MPIHLKKVSKYVNKLIKTKKGYDFPAWKITNDNSFWFALLTGVRNSGKSNTMLQILETEKQGMMSGENIVYWVSPTHDSKVEAVAEKHENNMLFYDELTISSFNTIIQDINERINDWKQTKFIFDLFEQYLKKQDSIDEEELNILFESGMLDDDTDVKELIKNFNFHHPPISSMVIDDSLGSALISSGNSKQGKDAMKFFIRHRHHYCNIFILTQHHKGINKTIRSNANAILLFPSKDRGIMKSIFEEFSPLFQSKIENYNEALDMLDKNPYSFLFIYYDAIKFLRLNFNQAITFG